MRFMSKGNFFGDHQTKIQLDGLILTDTEYTHDFVDWHYHENVYLTFLLKGILQETNRKEDYLCGPGGLLFHNWQEPHNNHKRSEFARGFHIELEKKWFDDRGLDLGAIEGSLRITNPAIKTLVLKTYHELKLADGLLPLAIEDLINQTFAELLRMSESNSRSIPLWAQRIKEILHDPEADKITLKMLAAETGIHPVHISHDFSKYFGTHLADYIRKIKIEKALPLLAAELPLTEIAYACGFADQSHFTRCFRKATGFTPLQYKKNIFS